MSDNLTVELMTVEECSKFIGLSISTIRKMCHRKEIPHIHLGRLVRFYKPEIKKWVLNNR